VAVSIECSSNSSSSNNIFFYNIRKEVAYTTATGILLSETILSLAPSIDSEITPSSHYFQKDISPITKIDFPL
jgi:hypothetical protein